MTTAPQSMIARGGACSLRGPRPSQEDRHCVVDRGWDVARHPALAAAPADGTAGRPSCSFYAVFDGHGGPKASNCASKELWKKYLQPALLSIEALDEAALRDAMLAAFEQTEQGVLRASSAGGDWDDGTTAVCALVLGSTLVLGNLGDSRMVLCRRSGEAKRLTTDHKPEEEAERIVAAGGFLQVVGGVARLEGDLSVSRAFGDREYKKAGGGSGALSAVPDVGVVDLLRADAAFLILACDGVWDVYSDAEACDLVRTGLRQNEGDPEAAASFLADCTVADARCTDNVTVVVVVLERRDAPELPAEAAAAPEPEAGQPP